MKLLVLSVVALGAVLLGGCAGENGYYTPSQQAAQHAGYDPTPHTYGTYY